MPKNKYSKKDNNAGKLLVVLGALFGIFSILAFYVKRSLGTWWSATMDPILGQSVSIPVDAFGVFTNSDSAIEVVLGAFGFLTGIFIIIGAIIGFIGVFKDSKGISLLGGILMIISILLFIIGLNSLVASGTIQDLVEIFNENPNLNTISGTSDVDVLSVVIITWTWDVGTGFVLGTIGAALTFIGALMV